LPLYVKWEWQERTKSYLVIFLFIDDFSKPNLRIKTYPTSHKVEMTWAPSHIELGMLSELLMYANIIGGLSETARKQLRKKLEVAYNVRGALHIDQESLIQLDKIPDKTHIIAVGEKESEFWAYMCPEYLEHVKSILKPYF
jgi:hypothetical protein